jgi:Ca-activated chloride channel family protein
MPLTSDPGIIRFFASELNPAVMPVAGDEPEQAIALAQNRLAESGLPGSIVLVADSVPEPFTPAEGADVHILAVAAGPEVVPPAGSPPAPALDQGAMLKAAKAGGGEMVTVTVDSADIQKLTSYIESSISAAPTQEGERWKDAGYGLMMLLLLVALPLSRKGGAVRLES